MIVKDSNVYDSIGIEAGLAVFELCNYVHNEEWINQFSVTDFYGIIWRGSKKISHFINHQEISVPKNHFLFIAPGVSHKFSTETNADAYFIVFKQEFYSKSIEDNLR